ncbi:MAG: hypothetical protein QM674_04035 [Burkholderiaceae bacterium]
MLDAEQHRAPYQDLPVDEWMWCKAMGVDVAMARGRLLSEDESAARQPDPCLGLNDSINETLDVLLIGAGFFSPAGTSSTGCANSASRPTSSTPPRTSAASERH